MIRFIDTEDCSVGLYGEQSGVERPKQTVSDRKLLPSGEAITEVEEKTNWDYISDTDSMDFGYRLHEKAAKEGLKDNS